MNPVVSASEPMNPPFSNHLSTLPDRALHKNAILALANGQVFEGFALGVNGVATTGEVVFNTSMTGYQEILTDPSYYRQIIAFTAPHIGNTGINEEDIESSKIFAAGLVMHQLPTLSSSARQQKTFLSYMKEHQLVGISGVDTRRLTRMIRNEGAQGACIASLGVNNIQDLEKLKSYAIQEAKTFGSMSGKALAYEVSGDKTYDWTQGEWRLSGYMTDAQSNQDLSRPLVAVLDFGVKLNILRRLVAHGCRVNVFPAKTSADMLLADNPAGILLSNGPGDPEPCVEAINTIKTLLEKKIPIFGICLGHQLLGLAMGAKTKKMKFGHHGANHPVIDEISRKVMITSQNHGFAIDDNDLPDDLIITHRSLFDGSVQGFSHRHLPFFGFQGHPEASPGPQDIDTLFAQFLQRLRAHA